MNVTLRSEQMHIELQLILSLFPGAGILDKGFEDAGFCVVRGPDLIWGGDIRRFHPPPHRFQGVIGGPPCQDFSGARWDDATGYGVTMLSQFRRCVLRARPDWWLMENVPGVPDMRIPGYNWQRIDLYASEFGLNNRRLRYIQFGSRRNMVLVMSRGERVPETQPAALATDTETPWDKFVQRQGLPADFDLPAFTVVEKRRAVGNAVPYPMALALARAVAGMVPADSVRLCECGCARPVSGRKTRARAACRMRIMRRNRNSAIEEFA